ncbi:pilus assembly PilX family protein [Acidithiobacillus sp.]
MKQRDIHPQEGGATMIIVLLVLVALTIILLAAIYMTRSDTMVAGNLRFRAEAAQSAGNSYQTLLSNILKYSQTNSTYLPTSAVTTAGNPCANGTNSSCCYAPNQQSVALLISSLNSDANSSLWCNPTQGTLTGTQFATRYTILATSASGNTIGVQPSAGVSLNPSAPPLLRQMYYYIVLVAAVDPNASHTQIIQSYTVALPAQ